MTDDERYMDLALAEAAKGRARSSPNPSVGAAVVKDGQLLAVAHHQRAGEPHAEILALRQVGEGARGATLYTTLEPCNHFGRTPPCSQAVIDAGISRVVIGVPDPNPQVAGQGSAALQQAGLQVRVGVRAAACRREHEPFFVFSTLGRPFVTAKAAVSLDGALATRSGASFWITGDAARLDSHRLRNQVDAIVVGVGTVRADDPSLTVRLPAGHDGHQPVRVVLDEALHTPPLAKLCGARALIYAAADQSVAPEERARALRATGAQVVRVPTADRGLDLAAVLADLAQRELVHLMVEGGRGVHTSFFEQRLVDRVRVYVAPLLVGGDQAIRLLGGVGPDTMDGAVRLRDVRITPLGDDVRIEGVPCWPGDAGHPASD